MRTKTGLVAATLWLAAMGRGGAQSPEVYERLTGPQLQQLLQSWGYRAELDKDDEGDPEVRAGISGRNVQVYFYGCNREQATRTCTAVQFYMGVKTEHKVEWSIINTWNHEKRYVKLYLTDSGAVHAEMDVPLTGGVTAAYLKNTVSLYETAIPEILSALPD
jgi:hypothetical protein